MVEVQIAYTFHKSTSALTMNEKGRLFELVGKLQRPSSAEVAANPRARSAVMRIAERNAEPRA